MKYLFSMLCVALMATTALAQQCGPRSISSLNLNAAAAQCANGSCNQSATAVPSQLPNLTLSTKSKSELSDADIARLLARLERLENQQQSESSTSIAVETKRSTLEDFHQRGRATASVNVDVPVEASVGYAASNFVHQRVGPVRAFFDAIAVNRAARLQARAQRAQLRLLALRGGGYGSVNVNVGW